jgi:hypothetical protein
MNQLGDFFPQSNRAALRATWRRPVGPVRACHRCNDTREIPMVGRGKRGGNAGKVLMIRCPACGGGGAT